MKKKKFKKKSKAVIRRKGWRATQVMEDRRRRLEQQAYDLAVLEAYERIAKRLGIDA